MGIIGAIMVARWCVGLLVGASGILLDHQASSDIRKQITGIMESYRDTKVCDLHLWSIGPGIYSAAISVVSKYPDAPDKYKTMIPSNSGVVHATVEVQICKD